MAGIDLTNDRRSQLLEQLLKQQTDPRQRPIQSGGELAARLGAQLIRQQQIKKLQGEEKASQQELVDALQGKLPRTEKTLEGFDDVAAESVSIPGKRVNPDAAISRLPPQQQIAAMQLQAGRRELAEPTKSQQSETDFERQLEIQKRQLDAALEREELGITAKVQQDSARFAQRDKELMKNLDHDELKQIRGIQAQFGLLDKKIDAAIEAAAGAGGDFKSSQWIAAGYGVRAEDAGAVIDSVGSKFTGVISRGVGLAPEGLKTKDRQRFDQAKRNFINAQLRRESGAVISEQEFENADQQYFPQPGNKKDVLEQKSRNRQVVINALRGEAAGAYDQLKSRLGATNASPSNTSSFTDGQTASDGQGNTVVYRNGEWVPQ